MQPSNEQMEVDLRHLMDLEKEVLTGMFPPYRVIALSYGNQQAINITVKEFDFHVSE